jgi:hypothetical protein
MLEIEIVNEDHYSGPKSFAKKIQELLNDGYVLKEFNSVMNSYNTVKSIAFLQRETKNKVQI